MLIRSVYIPSPINIINMQMVVQKTRAILYERPLPNLEYSYHMNL